MIESYFRSTYQRYFVDSVAIRLSNNLTANQLTFLGLLFGLLVPLALFYSLNIIAITCLLTSGYLDTLDGTVARM